MDGPPFVLLAFLVLNLFWQQSSRSYSSTPQYSRSALNAITHIWWRDARACLIAQCPIKKDYKLGTVQIICSVAVQ